MKARVAIAVVGALGFVVYWLLRALRYHAEAEAIRAAGRLGVKAIAKRRAELDRVA